MKYIFASYLSSWFYHNLVYNISVWKSRYRQQLITLSVCFLLVGSQRIETTCRGILHTSFDISIRFAPRDCDKQRLSPGVLHSLSNEQTERTNERKNELTHSHVSVLSCTILNTRRSFVGIYALPCRIPHVFNPVSSPAKTYKLPLRIGLGLTVPDLHQHFFRPHPYQPFVSISSNDLRVLIAFYVRVR